MKTQKTTPKLNKTFKTIDGKESKNGTGGLSRTFSAATLRQSTKFRTYKGEESGEVFFIENLQNVENSNFRKSVNAQIMGF